MLALLKQRLKKNRNYVIIIKLYFLNTYLIEKVTINN